MRFLLAVLMFLGASSVHALSLIEKKKFAEATARVNDVTKGNAMWFKNKCGYELPITIKEDVAQPFIAKNLSIDGYCSQPREAMAKLCTDDAKTYKQPFTEKVKSITCSLGKDGEATFKLNGTELQYTVGAGARNVADQATKFLQNNL